MREQIISYKRTIPGSAGMQIVAKGIQIIMIIARSFHSVTGRFGPIPVRTPGRFGPIPFRSGRFGLGRFGPISGVGRFGPTGAGRFGPLYFKYTFRC